MSNRHSATITPPDQLTVYHGCLVPIAFARKHAASKPPKLTAAQIAVVNVARAACMARLGEWLSAVDLFPRSTRLRGIFANLFEGDLWKPAALQAAGLERRSNGASDQQYIRFNPAALRPTAARGAAATPTPRPNPNTATGSRGSRHFGKETPIPKTATPGRSCCPDAGKRDRRMPLALSAPSTERSMFENPTRKYRRVRNRSGTKPASREEK